jgi:hypothetical protein
MKQFQFYVTDFAPNGCQDLLVVNQDGDIIDVCSEGVYGMHVTPKKACIAFNEQIVDDQELKHSLMDASSEDITYCYKAKLSTILRHIAVSPVSDGSEVIKFIKQYAKVP